MDSVRERSRTAGCVASPSPADGAGTGAGAAEGMRVSAGLLVLWRGRALLVKQRIGSGHSIPKGTVEEGEDLLSAAIRETAEETGLAIDPGLIRPGRHLCSISVRGCRRRLFYYIADLPDGEEPALQPADREEIEGAAFHTVRDAARLIQASQAGLLWTGEGPVPAPVLDRLEDAGWIRRIPHPYLPLSVVSYTRLCKREQAWNEMTLWARGMAVRDDGTVAARSMRKFFEWDQLYPECRPHGTAEVTEKIDGHLAFSYFDGRSVLLASRGSFCSRTAVEATGILHRLHPAAAARMSPDLTYVFEAVYPSGRLVLDYGDEESLTLLDVVEPSTGRSVLHLVPDHGFPVPEIHPSVTDIAGYLAADDAVREGVVLRYPDGERVKVKFPSFKERYMRKFHPETKTPPDEDNDEP